MANQELSDSELSIELDRLLRPTVESRVKIDSLIGERLGPYEIIERIGSGSFGVVYRATDTRTKANVAIKVLRDEIISSEVAIERFKREALVASKLDHPHIIRLIEDGLSENPPFLAIEYMDGKDLGRWHVQQGMCSQPIDRMVRFLLPLIDAIEYAHKHGVLHRDIKPGNILLKRRDALDFTTNLDGFSPMLADFGLAKIASDVLLDSRSSLTIGTPMYMAPEQLVPTWGIASPRTDIYAFGVLMAELANGRPPRYGMNLAEVMQDILHQRRDLNILWADSVPERFRSIVRRCLEKDPIDRYATISELRNAVESLNETPSRRTFQTNFWQRFITWARHPDRPNEVCFFVITLNLIMFAWMIFNAYVILGPYYHGDERTSDVVQCLGIAFGNNLFTALLCLLRIYGKRWAVWVALTITSAITVAVPLLTAMDAIHTFQGLYEKAPFFRIANHAQILLFGLVQSTLLAICLFSDLASRKRHVASSLPQD